MLHVCEAAMLFERASAALAAPLAIRFARDNAYPVHTGSNGWMRQNSVLEPLRQD